MKKEKTKMIVFIGLLVALHIILSRWLSINAWNLKIGFAFAATFIGAYLYGPVGGMLVGGFGDLLGALLFPIGPYFPGFTLDCALTGLIFGLFLYKKQSKFRIGFAVAIDQILISLFLNTYWISILYGSAYWPIFVTRIVQVVIMIIVQFVTIMGLIKALKKLKVKSQINDESIKTNENTSNF